MKKILKQSLHILNTRKLFVCKHSRKKDIKREIRGIADNYEDFNNLVFELGCEMLAKAYMKN